MGYAVNGNGNGKSAAMEADTEKVQREWGGRRERVEAYHSSG